jgi:molybdopterin synthase catalytic subunit
MRITVLFFGVLKDIAGRAEEEIDIESGACLADVFARYAARFPRLREMERSIVVASNRQFANRTAIVAEGDEVAFLPPVSGGAPGLYTHEIAREPGHFFALTREPIDTRALAAGLARGEDGALVAFEGVVRNNSEGRATLYLDYECYEAMAIEVMARIGCEIAAGREVGRIVIVHRLGRLDIGETSLAVLVTAPHRQPAFAAALEAIGRVKRSVPIWKKERFADGEVWVEGQWDESVNGL